MSPEHISPLSVCYWLGSSLLTAEVSEGMLIRYSRLSQSSCFPLGATNFKEKKKIKTFRSAAWWLLLDGGWTHFSLNVLALGCSRKPFKNVPLLKTNFILILQNPKPKSDISALFTHPPCHSKPACIFERRRNISEEFKNSNKSFPNNGSSFWPQLSITKKH